MPFHPKMYGDYLYVYLTTGSSQRVAKVDKNTGAVFAERSFTFCSSMYTPTVNINYTATAIDSTNGRFYIATSVSYSSSSCNGYTA